MKPDPSVSTLEKCADMAPSNVSWLSRTAFEIFVSMILSITTVDLNSSLSGGTRERSERCPRANRRGEPERMADPASSLKPDLKMQAH